MSNIVQRAIAAVDHLSAELSKTNTSCLRHPLRSLGVLRRTAVDAAITMHLEHARDHDVNGDRAAFERRCERAQRLARWHSPKRLDDVERLLESRSGRRT